MDRLSRFFSPNDKYLFVDDRSGPLFPIPRGTLLWQPNSWQNLTILTFIRHTDVPKRIAISPLGLKNIQQKYFGYILGKFDEYQSSKGRIPPHRHRYPREEIARIGSKDVGVSCRYRCRRRGMRA